MVFTTRLSGGKGGRNHLEAELRRLGINELGRLGIKQKNGKPNHPRPREGRAVPADSQEMAPRPAPPAGNPRRAADPAGRLHQHLQHLAAAPVPAAPGHPGHRLRRAGRCRFRRWRGGCSAGHRGDAGGERGAWPRAWPRRCGSCRMSGSSACRVPRAAHADHPQCPGTARRGTRARVPDVDPLQVQAAQVFAGDLAYCGVLRCGLRSRVRTPAG